MRKNEKENKLMVRVINPEVIEQAKIDFTEAIFKELIKYRGENLKTCSKCNSPQ